MHKPSVLFINRVYPPEHGATGRLLHDLAQEFSKDGWYVTVLTSGQQSSTDIVDSIRIRRVKGRHDKKITNYLMIWCRILLAALRLPRYDLVVTMTDPPMLATVGFLVTKKKGSHHVHWCQDLYPDLLPILGVKLPAIVMKALTHLSRHTMRNCDKVVVIGQCMARKLLQNNIEDKKLTLIQNWPDRELISTAQEKPIYDYLAKQRKQSAQSVEIPVHGSKFRILYAGTLGRAHPVATILDAAAILQEKHPEIEFLFVGEESLHEKIVAERTHRGLDNVLLLPTQPHERLRDMMQSGDIHLISMKHGAAGLLVPSKLYSALAAERPCILIGSEETETGKVLLESGAGVVIPQGKPEMLAQQISCYFSDGEAWFKAQTASAQAAAHFTPENMMGKWIAMARHTVKIPE